MAVLSVYYERYVGVQRFNEGSSPVPRRRSGLIRAALTICDVFKSSVSFQIILFRVLAPSSKSFIVTT